MTPDVPASEPLPLNPVFIKKPGFESNSVATRTEKELESRRNHSAHAQDIVTHDGARMARMTRRIEASTQR